MSGTYEIWIPAHNLEDPTEDFLRHLGEEVVEQLRSSARWEGWLKRGSRPGEHVIEMGHQVMDVTFRIKSS